jgi:signal peptidase I
MTSYVIAHNFESYQQMRLFYILLFGLICLLTILALRLALVVVTVEGPSMYPALSHGDRVLVLRIWPRSWIRKGHIVLVFPWLEAGRRVKLSDIPMPFIKRVAGVAGETIVTSISDLATELWTDHRAAHDTDGRRTWHIPPKHIFAISDNLPGGYDSLSWGPIPHHTVLGVVVKKLSHSTANTTEPGIGRRIASTARRGPSKAQERA